MRRERRTPHLEPAPPLALLPPAPPLPAPFSTSKKFFPRPLVFARYPAHFSRAHRQPDQNTTSRHIHVHATTASRRDMPCRRTSSWLSTASAINSSADSLRSTFAMLTAAEPSSSCHTAT